jgi:hypothetical protein
MDIVRVTDLITSALTSKLNSWRCSLSMERCLYYSSFNSFLQCNDGTLTCNLLKKFYTLAKVTLKPRKDGIFLKLLSHVFCLKSKGILTLHIVQTGKTRWGWTCIDLFHDSTWRSVVIFYQHLWISWLVQSHHLTKKQNLSFFTAFVNFTPCSITPFDQKTKFVIFYRHMQLPQLFNHTMWQE